MQFAKRTTAVIVVAAFVPLILLGFIEIAALLQEMRSERETGALARTAALLARVDGELRSDLGALSVLAGSPTILSTELESARERAAGVIAARPSWKNIILSDGISGKELWETALPDGDRRPARPAVLQFAASGLATQVQGFAQAPTECACVSIQSLIVVGNAKYVLTVDRAVSDFQAFLLLGVRPGEVGALVDRDGRFIGRTVDYENRRGTVATQYVLDAIAAGGSGVYDGTTFEGLRNRSTYATSDLSGWSVHIAGPSASYEALVAGSLGFSALAFGIALLFAGGLAWFGVRDLNNRRMMERAHFQSQKLEALGHLSGTVAHDFNNLLAAIVACLRIMGRKDGDADTKAEALAQGLSAADRGAKLIGQLLTFARDKPIEIECVDIEKSLEGVRDLLRQSLGPRIALEIAASPNARFANTNAAQFELALLNLAVNARDAMPEGGTFRILTRLTASRDWVDVLVSDTGPGMSEDVAARALEPFFTTKPEGKGTGLGLAQVNLLTSQSGGSLLLDTAPGKGALFTLRLPVCFGPDGGSP